METEKEAHQRAQHRLQNMKLWINLEVILLFAADLAAWVV